MATREQIGEMLMALTAAYNPRSELTAEEQWDVYCDVLGDLPGEVLPVVTKHYIRTRKWFPKPSEVVECYQELVELALGIPSADQAWAEVTRKLHTGVYQNTGRGWYELRAPEPTDWSHPLIAEAIEGMGGWLALRSSENKAVDRGRWYLVWDMVLKRARDLARMLPEVRAAVSKLADALSAQPDLVARGHQGVGEGEKGEVKR